MKNLVIVKDYPSQKAFEKLANEQTDVRIIGEALGAPGPYDLIVVVSDPRWNKHELTWIKDRLPLTLKPNGRIHYTPGINKEQWEECL